jgi:oleate hydratase
VRDKSADRSTARAYLVGGRIGSLAAAAFMIRDGRLPGRNISILEAAPITAEVWTVPETHRRVFIARRTYVHHRPLRKYLGSLSNEGKPVLHETVEFNERHSLGGL